MVVKQAILRNIKKPSKPFLRKAELRCTGFDITYGEEAQALRFPTQNVAIMIARALSQYGDFRAVEVDG